MALLKRTFWRTLTLISASARHLGSPGSLPRVHPLPREDISNRTELKVNGMSKLVTDRPEAALRES